MARTPDPAILAALTEKALDYVIAHGVTDLSLRPLAKAIDTSARMLIYHFGSREGLMHAIINRLREREAAAILERMDCDIGTMKQFLDWYWRRMSDRRARPILKIFHELEVLALRNPDAYPGMLTAPLDYWRKFAQKTGLGRNEAKVTLLLAVTRGLLLDLAATGERKRIDAAMALFADFIDG